ncbi:HlyD family secretion protein [Photobacterium japonica]|uniref:HlyD family secretion protein n=1 Tax=Photobacterium japonica TaxID=2910235 RepID=UPI003D1407C9
MNETPSHTLRNVVILTVIGLCLAVAGYLYIQHQKRYPSTEDAYVHANIIYVAPQVSGKVIATNAVDFQPVSKGDVLVQLDPAPYQAKLDEAKAAYELATQNNAATDDAILAASANVRSAMAKLADAQSTYRRVQQLVTKKLLPQQQLDDAKANLSSAENAVEAARANMSQLITAQGAKGTAAPEVKKAAAALSSASLSLSYTNIFASHDGMLGQLRVHPGSVVSPGQALVPLVESNSYWVQANFKEAETGRLKVGMAATIALDLYPDVEFSGVIESISPASGSSFSLLPPENATGNWVKVPQRFPVLIRLDNPGQQAEHPLRVGASSTVTIDTRKPLQSVTPARVAPLEQGTP